MTTNRAVIDRLLNILTEQAKKREFISYQELNKKLSPDGTGPFFEDIRDLFSALSKLATMMKIRRRPLITVIVIDVDRGEPGTGFFKNAKKLGFFRDDISKKSDRKSFCDYESSKVFSYSW